MAFSMASFTLYYINPQHEATSSAAPLILNAAKRTAISYVPAAYQNCISLSRQDYPYPMITSFLRRPESAMKHGGNEKQIYDNS